MPESLNYSPSGSEGERSPSRGEVDLDKSLLGVDLTHTPGTTPLKARAGNIREDVAHAKYQRDNSKLASHGLGRPPPSIITKTSTYHSSVYQCEKAVERSLARSEAASPSTPEEVFPMPRSSSHGSGTNNDKARAVSSEAASPLTAGDGVYRQYEEVPKVEIVSPGENTDVTQFHSETREMEAPRGEIADAPGNVAEENSDGYSGDRKDVAGVKDNSGGDFEQKIQHEHEDRGESFAHTIGDNEVGKIVALADNAAASQGIGQLAPNTRSIVKHPVVISRSTNGALDHVPGEQCDVDVRGKQSPSGEDGGISAAEHDATQESNTQLHTQTHSNSSQEVCHGRWRSSLPQEFESTNGQRVNVEEASTISREPSGTGTVDCRQRSHSSTLPESLPRCALTEASCAVASAYQTKAGHLQGSAQPPAITNPHMREEAERVERDPQSPPPLPRKSGRHTNGRSRSLTELASSSLPHSRRHSMQHPPPLTPKRGDRSMAITPPPLSPAPTLSPVAVAARAISLEESAISTARVLQAAEAIALEDRAGSVEEASTRDNSIARARLLGEASDWSEDEESDEERESLDYRKTRRVKGEMDGTMRPRSLQAEAARRDAPGERDRALELTLEVLRRRDIEKEMEGRKHEGRYSPLARTRVQTPRRRSRRPEDHRSNGANRVKDSAARTCGLNPAQVVLLKKSRELGRGNSHSSRSTKQRRDILAQPKEGRPATRTRDPATEPMLEELTRGMTAKDKRDFLYACLTDAKECTHRPRTQSSASGRRGTGEGGRKAGSRDNDVSGAKNAFLYRMKAQERAKTAAVEHRRGELAYKAVLDKKTCSSCGAEQSFDEPTRTSSDCDEVSLGILMASDIGVPPYNSKSKRVKEKRKTCPNCNVEYRKPRTWATVRKDFFKRTAAFESSKQASLSAATVRQKQEMYRDKEATLLWEDVEDDFITRLKEDTVRRQAFHDKICSTPTPPDCTFQPELSSATAQYTVQSPWLGMTFLERMENDLQRRREMPAAASEADADYDSSASNYKY